MRLCACAWEEASGEDVVNGWDSGLGLAHMIVVMVICTEIFIYIIRWFRISYAQTFYKLYTIYLQKKRELCLTNIFLTDIKNLTSKNT